MTHKELIEKHKLSSTSSTATGLLYKLSDSLYMSYSIINDEEICRLIRIGRFKDGRYISDKLMISGSVNTMNRYISSIMIRKIRYEDHFRFIETGNQIKI
jgi:hypothetical protein